MYRNNKITTKYIIQYKERKKKKTFKINSKWDWTKYEKMKYKENIFVERSVHKIIIK